MLRRFIEIGLSGGHDLVAAQSWLLGQASGVGFGNRHAGCWHLLQHSAHA